MAETRRSIGEKEMSEKEAIVSRARDIKEFHNTVGQRAAARCREKNAQIAQGMRAEMDERLHRHLLGTDPASAEQIQSVSLKMNEALARMIVDRTKRAWIKLFHHADGDGSGLIDFAELLGIVRNDLNMTTAQLSQKELESVWVTLDADSSGHISVGEFGAFMRLQGHIHDAEATAWKERLERDKLENASTMRQHKSAEKELRLGLSASELEARAERARAARAALRPIAQRAAEAVYVERKANADVMRREKHERLHRDIADELKGHEGASREQVVHVSERLNKIMFEIMGDTSWIKLFHHMDDDASGLISYAELIDMIRNELFIRASTMPDREVKAVWLALDEDNSGHISVGEFGNFMRLGDHVHDEMRQEKLRKRAAEKERVAAEVRRHIAENLEAQRLRKAEDEAAKHERAARAKLVAEEHARHVAAEAAKEQARRRAEAREKELLQAKRVLHHVGAARESHAVHTQAESQMRKVLAEHKARKEALEKKLKDAVEHERATFSDERTTVRSNRSVASQRTDASTV